MWRDTQDDSACDATWPDACTASTCSSGSPRSDSCSVRVPDSWEDWAEEQEGPCAAADQASLEMDTTQPAFEPEPAQAPTGASPLPSPCPACTAVLDSWEDWTEEHEAPVAEVCSLESAGSVAVLAEPVSVPADVDNNAERATSSADASTSDGVPSGVPLDAAAKQYIADHGLAVLEFSRDKCLGKGAFGRAYLVQVPLPDGSRIPAVLKRMRATTSPAMVAAEVEALSRLRGCAGCVQLLAHGEHNFRQALLLEYCPGGTLADRLDKAAWRAGYPFTSQLILPVPALRELAAQLFTALANVHAAGLVHQDIKPANLLYAESGELRIADFGTAAARLDNGLYDTTGAGSLLYMAPEVITSRKLKPTHPITDKADVYSAGATLLDAAWLYHDCTRHWGFTHGPSTTTIAPFMPESLLHFLRTLLHEDPQKRPSARDALESDWMCGCNE